MRTKDPKTMEAIREAIDRYYRKHHEMPTVRELAALVGVSKATVQRYLVAMDEQGIIRYDGQIRSTEKAAKCSTEYFSAPLVGSIRCGNPETEEEYVEEYVSLPESIFGKGSFYILRAAGDSMTDAGIDDGDLVVIELQKEASVGDVVVALDQDGQNTLKRYAGWDAEKQCYLLEYMNEEVYPGKAIEVKCFVVQGVARHIIKTVSAGRV